MVLLSLLSGLGFTCASTFSLAKNRPISMDTSSSVNLQLPLSLNQSPPLTCTTSSDDLKSLVSCHVSLVIKRELDAVAYNSIQPMPSEQQTWSETIRALLDIDGNCLTIARNLPGSLKGSYTILELGGYCAFVEVSTVDSYNRSENEYMKGWGMFVVPTGKENVKRSIHLSAPHPVDDLLTGQQAGHIFEKTGAKSLYIAGRARSAFRQRTNCIESAASTTYWKTDPAHDKEEMMFETYKTILDWQNTKGGCNSESCAYLQIHGKGSKTCLTDQAFMSSGLGRDPASVQWYEDPLHAALPIHRLSKHFTSYFPTWNATLPSSPYSNCPLTATKNIIGRLINGVPEENVCNQEATAEETKGAFVHIEQAMELRMIEQWETWVNVVLASFEN